MNEIINNIGVVRPEMEETMYYFYCPNCGREEEVKSVPRDSVGNIRDGWGIPIHHYKCPNCGNLDAGSMRMKYADDGWKEYCQYTIGLYQGIRGFEQK